jgi:hypothetical protein
MNPARCFLRSVVPAAAVVVALWAAGCSNPFITKHKVLVDAISAPGLPKPVAVSYRLLAKKSVVSQVQAQVSVIKACVDAALTGKGLYEAPPTVPPDIFIEVSYGVNAPPGADPSSRETFLQLSARANPDRSQERGTGPEVWDVRVAVLGIAGRLETAMPLLCTVASDYLGTDTHMETKIEIPQNSPVIGAVRASAIKTLEAAATAKGSETTDAQSPAVDASAAAKAAVTPVK